jgi:dTDP-4-amino-4,6-dideoxygalactose transaminase
MGIANKYNLIVMQDCAQSYGSYYKGRACGTQAHLATFSFHETKNFNAGEGGALVVNKEEWYERARFLQEKGTDRSLVIKGVKNKYSWVDKGSSYLLSDILASILLAQLEKEDEMKMLRSKITEAYITLFSKYENKVSFFKYSKDIEINHHAFWVVFDTKENSELFMSKLKEKSIYAYIGYLPLHSSPKGIKFGYKASDLPHTEDLASRIVRLPFFTELGKQGLDYCISAMKEVLDKIYK